MFTSKIMALKKIVTGLLSTPDPFAENYLGYTIDRTLHLCDPNLIKYTS